MYKVKDFIAWAVSHAKGGAEPWQYLFGSVRVKTTQNTLDRYYENHYSRQMSRAEYDSITADWDRNGYATDCQGLCDAYLTYECGEQTDINADTNYRNWCTDKGKIDEINRGWVIGEAVFRANSAGRMTHVGWVCGFDGAEPLIVEARDIRYGVVITHLWDRDFTYRGLMTKKFSYTEEPAVIKFEVTSPMHQGMEYAKMQDALNYAGITDNDGNPLEVDGKWGRKSQQAFDKLIAEHAPKPEPAPEPMATFYASDGRYRLVLEYK